MKKIDYVIDALIKYNKEIQETKVYMFTGIGRVAYAKECQTVKIDVGRQTGKSWYIARTAKPEDIIVCMQNYTADIMKERINGFNFEFVKIITPPDIFEMKIEIDYDTVWIDDAYHFDKKVLNDVYFKFAGKCKQFVLIG